VLSQYLEGELDSEDRRALEAHVRGCADCRAVLDSLSETIRALGSMPREPAASVADSIITALRADSSTHGEERGAFVADPDVPALTLVPQPASPSGRALSRWRSVRAVVRYCSRGRQLRFTVPVAVAAGVALSLINQAGMLFDGRIDVGMCAMCAANFVVPFVAINAALLILLRGPRRGNTPT
jgi:anti-sigma factor RsiW